MKRLFLAIIFILSAAASSAATLVPVQLLNPSGSTSGQVIVSTGSSSAPAWGGIGVNGIASIAANTVLANATGASSSPTAFVMPACATALEWTAGTGFVCNTSGAFTTLNASGNDALLYQNSGTQSFTSGTPATVTGWTKVYDRVNANFNASTGTFTAPATGYYQVSGQIQFAQAAGIVGSAVALQIVANGVTVASGETWVQAIGTTYLTCAASAIVLLSSGQTVVVQGNQTSGSSRAMSGTAANNYLSINRLP